MDTCRTDARAFQVHIPLTVKTYDVDFSGVASHLTFLRWIEDLRLQMLREHPALQRQVDSGGVPVVAHTTVHYREPVGLGETLRGSMWVSRTGRCRWTLRAEFDLRGRVAVLASQSGCFLDPGSRRPVTLHAEIRARVTPPAPVQAPHAPRAERSPGPRRGWHELLGTRARAPADAG